MVASSDPWGGLRAGDIVCSLLDDDYESRGYGDRWTARVVAVGWSPMCNLLPAVTVSVFLDERNERVEPSHRRTLHPAWLRRVAP